MTTLLTDLKELNKVKESVRPPINGVDSADLMSVDSTTPIVTDADSIEGKENEGDAESSNTEVKPKAKEVEGEEVVEEELNEDGTPKKPDVKPKEETKPETKDAVQKRIDEITKKRRTAERERDFEKKKRLELEAEVKKLKAAIPAKDKPKKEDFEDQDAYIEALVDWKADQKIKGVQEEAVKVTEEDTEKEALQEFNDKIVSAVEQGREKYKDFDQLVMVDTLIMPPEMTSIILESEIAADIMYYFGSNPDESAEIAKLSPLKAAKKIAEIEAELVKDIPKENDSQLGDLEDDETNKNTNLPVKPKVKVTKATPPIKPVKQTGVVEKDPSQMTMAEYRVWRENNKG
jgi:hypothetical protein